MHHAQIEIEAEPRYSRCQAEPGNEGWEALPPHCLRMVQDVSLRMPGMSLVRDIEICQLASVKGGMVEFYTPQSSHETMLVQIPAGTIVDSLSPEGTEILSDKY